MSIRARTSQGVGHVPVKKSVCRFEGSSWKICNEGRPVARSGTTNGNEWQWVARSGNGWQGVAVISGHHWSSRRERSQRRPEPRRREQS